MKARAFDYVKAVDLPDAIRLLAEEDAVALAGGQSLMAGMNLRLSAPSLLVDISGLDALRGIRVDGETIAIGALTRHFELVESELICSAAPLLREAARHIAHAAIRNRGTIGGSLAYADPAAELPACVVALDATLCIDGPNGARHVRAKDFFVGLFETAMRPGELVTQILIPAQMGRARYGFDEIARRPGDFAMAGLVIVADGEAPPPHFVYFGCADRPKRAPASARLAWHHDFSGARSSELADAMQREIDPSDSAGCRADTKLKLAFALTKRLVERMRRDTPHVAC